MKRYDSALWSEWRRVLQAWLLAHRTLKGYAMHEAMCAEFWRLYEASEP